MYSDRVNELLPMHPYMAQLLRSESAIVPKDPSKEVAFFGGRNQGKSYATIEGINRLFKETWKAGFDQQPDMIILGNKQYDTLNSALYSDGSSYERQRYLEKIKAQSSIGYRAKINFDREEPPF